MVPPHRGGTFSPSPAQSLVTASNHSPHGSFSAGPSPSTNSPTNNSGSGVNRITVAQIYLLLSTIKEGKNWDQQAEQLRKLVDEQEGMDVWYKYFARLVVGNAPQIFPGVGKPAVGNPGNYGLLVEEVRKIAKDKDQAGKIAGAIETGSEDIFQDFDLSTFMDHFKLDAYEKTVLAVAFKTGTRPNLKAKADAILSTNYPAFLTIISQPNEYKLDDNILALTLDRYIQGPPPVFDEMSKRAMLSAVFRRGEGALTEVLAAVNLLYLLNDQYSIVVSMHEVGASFTTDEETCITYLRKIQNLSVSEEQVAPALLYSAISLTPTFSTQVLVAALRKEASQAFSWQRVVELFDRPDLRITPSQFFSLFDALLPIARDNSNFDIEKLWGGYWQHPETQLSFIRAWALQNPETVDVSAIPRFQQSFSLEDYVGAQQDIVDRAVEAVHHPLVSKAAILAIFHSALMNQNFSQTTEAKRLFQDAVLPNLEIFIVSAYTVEKPWSPFAEETLTNLFRRFLYKQQLHWNFALYSLWHRDKRSVVGLLATEHGKQPTDLHAILEHAHQLHWLEELVLYVNGFALDLAALAHSKNLIDLDLWARNHAHHPNDLRIALLTFLKIKAEHEILYQQRQKRQAEQDIAYDLSFAANNLESVMLPPRTIYALLNILMDLSPKHPGSELVGVQRTCITAYPRLINYGQGYDDIIDANGKDSNSLPQAANEKMEEHYKRMYSDEEQVREVVASLGVYKTSRDPFDQDVFACMIHGLFDEYALYYTYPNEALATTAVLFGGIIQSKLISELPLEIGLGMILEAVKDSSLEQSMYKFGLQALLQLLGRLHEWPGFCEALLQVPGLRGTEAWQKAEEVLRDHNTEMERNGNGNSNGGMEGMDLRGGLLTPEPTLPPFNSVNVEPSRYADKYEEPSSDIQDKVVFVLNNTTESNLEAKFKDLSEILEEKYQGWFAEHLVEQRAKMQSNYLQLYLNLLRLFDSKTLYYEVLRETYVSVRRMINAESTLHSSSERTNLRSLAGWLGSLTLARDKPILHRHIAFKQLLIEAFDTQRLLVVVPFVCRVLQEAASSVVFKPPNPWLMDIVHLLIELYRNADLKLNLKFDIEILCRDLSLDYKSIEASTDIQSRVVPADDSLEPIVDGIENRFENLALSGTVGSGRFSPNDIVSTVPDLGPLLTYPPPNEMVNQQGLQEIVRSAITRAVHEIISPVVERSVTIAAISTAQMIRKDFATEPDEEKVRAAAIAMVKKTAGSLALVTSKEPLRASMNNYIRQLQTTHNQGLPEGTIIMCVNSNLDMACQQVEKKAEEKAVPEIEEILQGDLENRRQHRLSRPNDPFMDNGTLSRWGMTIPHPYKLGPDVRGLNEQQLAIYDEFARQPRIAAPSAAGPSISDANKPLAIDAFDGQFPPVSGLPTPGDTIPHLLNQQSLSVYQQRPVGLANGRSNQVLPDTKIVIENILKLYGDLLRLTADAPEQQYQDLPHSHPIIVTIDRLCQLIITTPRADSASGYTAQQICQTLFTRDPHIKNSELTMESLVHLLGQLCKMHPDKTGRMVSNCIANESDEMIFNIPLALALLRTDFGLLDWQRIDEVASKAILERKDGALKSLNELMDKVLLNDRPEALRTDLVRSLDALGQRLAENPEHENGSGFGTPDSDLAIGRQLMRKLRESGVPPTLNETVDPKSIARQDHMEYVFEEWVHLCNNPMASNGAQAAMVSQIDRRRLIHDPDDSVLFFRTCIEVCVERFEHIVNIPGNIDDAYGYTDALAKLIARLVVYQGETDDGMVKSSKSAYLKSTMAVVALVINHHHIVRGENFCQRVFFRLFSTTMIELNRLADASSVETEEHKFVLIFAHVLMSLQPHYLPGFAFGWMSLISHRAFLPRILGLEGELGWESFLKILECLFQYLGELCKPLHLSPVARDMYRAVLKMLLILQRDYPSILCENHIRLTAALPPHCAQLQNMILTAKPTSYYSLPNPMDPALKVDHVEGIHEDPTIRTDFESPLLESNLFDIVARALKTGPHEALVADIAHAMQQKNGHATTIGFVPVNVDINLINAIVLFVGKHSIRRAAVEGGPTFISGSPDASLLNMLAKELKPEARYYFIIAIVNQLRYPNSHTYYFSQVLLDLFGTDQNDHEEAEVRQQITRVLFERLSTCDGNQPWGVVVTIVELLKNPKYMFFDLPFVSGNPEIARQFTFNQPLALH